MHRVKGPVTPPSVILCSIQVAGIIVSRLITQILWVIRHAQVIGTSSTVAVPASSSSSFVDQFSSWCRWAGCPSPPGVDHSTTTGTRRTLWTWWPLVSYFSVFPISARQSITTVSTLQQFNSGASVIILISTC